APLSRRPMRAGTGGFDVTQRQPGQGQKPALYRWFRLHHGQLYEPARADAAVGNGLAAGHPVNNPLAGHKIRVRPIFRPVVAKRGPLVGRRPRSIHTIEPRTWADEPTKKPTPAVAGVGRPTRFQTA